MDQEYIDIRGPDNVNAQTLQQLIDEIRARHPEADRIILILDKARYNHAKMVRAHIEQTQVELKFLPSYSPNLNLIERLWRFLKGKVTSDYHPTFADFVAEIDAVGNRSVSAYMGRSHIGFDSLSAASTGPGRSWLQPGRWGVSQKAAVKN